MWINKLYWKKIDSYSQLCNFRKYPKYLKINENIFFECNFDSSSNLEDQCGGIETKIDPQTSLADISLHKNELVSGSSPYFSLTDVKSISKLDLESN